MLYVCYRIAAMPSQSVLPLLHVVSHTEHVYMSTGAACQCVLTVHCVAWIEQTPSAWYVLPCLLFSAAAAAGQRFAACQLEVNCRLC